jgi:ribosomal protein S18 acetylase RimI-like enzyme
VSVEIAVRPIADGDEETVVRLWRACGLIRPWNDPAADLAMVRASGAGTVLVGEVRGALAASVMAGFDGHRGWIYYLAVRPDLQGQGYGRAMLSAAEAWLRGQGCPKVELMVRPDNAAVLEIYRRLGYHAEDRAVLAKWLTPPKSLPPEAAGPRMLDVTISYLEMTAPPARAPAKPPQTPLPLALQRLHRPTVSYYRYLQHGVGDPWLWWERRVMPDEALEAIIRDEAVEIYVLSEGAVPAGFVELDFRAMPARAEIAYFGLLPDWIGRALGPYLLNWAVDCAWSRDPRPEALTVNTCTLDHPKALSAYQKAGFQVTARETKQVPDPIQAGHIPKTTRVLTLGY